MWFHRYPRLADWTWRRRVDPVVWYRLGVGLWFGLMAAIIGGPVIWLIFALRVLP